MPAEKRAFRLTAQALMGRQKTDEELEEWHVVINVL